MIYAIFLGWPNGDFEVKNLGTAAATQSGAVKKVRLLGCLQKFVWSQTAEALTVKKPAKKPSEFAYVIKVYLS